jgi:seryl-tRNA synthetase
MSFLTRALMAVLAEPLAAQAKEQKKAQTREGLKLGAAMAVGAVTGVAVAVSGVAIAMAKKDERRYLNRRFEDLSAGIDTAREDLQEARGEGSKERSELRSEINSASTQAFEADIKVAEAMRNVDDLLKRVKELEEEEPKVHRASWAPERPIAKD